MEILRWVACVLAWLVSALPTAAALVLAWMLMDSVGGSRPVGAGVALAGLAWLGLPAAGTWLVFRTEHAAAGWAVLAVGAVASVFVAWFIAGGVEAAARP